MRACQCVLYAIVCRNFPTVAAGIKEKYPLWLSHIGEVYEELPGGEFMEGTGRSGAQDTYDLLFDNRTGQEKKDTAVGGIADILGGGETTAAAAAASKL